MAQFKCKMCGGAIEAVEGQTIVKCEFCETEQTIPSFDNEKKTKLHNRANSLRLKNEFDKAIITYESIISEFPNDAEAHWGLLLCRYGIEYVDDSKTGKKIPTCHRTQYKSIFDDIDYKAAIDNSDVLSKEMYQKEAEEINRIQKSILFISQKEEDFDIFICYKETDEKGKRTRDSVIAQDIYEELTRKKYKVFFARVTLETKLGSQYEPYIFAALNSSKVMLVIGTKPEYFNAIWVKNEWNRFILLMDTSKDKKYLIPCYRDMDAYELPEEMLSFQAQDMNKLGFIQDLTRGIDKIFNKTENKEVTPSTEKPQMSSPRSNISALLRRAEILISDDNPNKANEILDEVLNLEPENAKAYVLLLLIELRLKNEPELAGGIVELTSYKNYNRAIQFADEPYKRVLFEYNKEVQKNIEKERILTIYNKAVNERNKKNYKEAINMFEQIIDYKDSNELIIICNELIEKEKEEKYVKALDLINNHEYKEAIKYFLELADYKDAKSKVEEAKVLEQKKQIYNKAVNEKNKKNYEEAINMFEQITDYKDSNELIIICNEIILNYQNKRRKRKIVIKSSIIITLLLICLTFLTFTVFIPMYKYNKAQKYIEEKDYNKATKILLDLDGYKETEILLKEIDTIKFLQKTGYEKGIKEICKEGYTVNISYDGNGGTPEIPFQKTTTGEVISNIAVKEKHTFYEWLIEKCEIDRKNDYTINIVLKAMWSIEFGSYPQSQVTDTILIDALNSKTGLLPTSSNSYNWTSYKYYIEGSNATDFMWYIDITQEESTYRGVYFTSHRPNYTEGSSIANYSSQYYNDYTTGDIYWFKYEPIKWKILSISNDKYTLLSNFILDSQNFYYSSDSRTINSNTIYPNNYEYSSIRTWLNDNFLKTSFSNSQQSKILTTLVDNSVSTTNSSTNPYTCNNTNDKVYLLSHKDVYNTSYGFTSNVTRCKQATDYAKCMGASVNDSNGNSYWWLRSPNSKDDNYALFISYVGNWFSDYVYSTDYGVVPVLKIIK